MENKFINMKQNNAVDNFVKTDDILKDMYGIIESSRNSAYKAVNSILVQRNWLIGYRIAEEELQGANRAEYGASVIKKLAKELTAAYGKGFTKSNLYSFYSFYKAYPNIFQTVSGKSLIQLSWSHYAILLQVNEKEARAWYEKEAIEQTWSVRTLQRNISSQYYYRMLQTQKKELVEQEMKDLTTDEDIARYSIMHGNEQLFASKYKLYLPTEEELRAEIETQKTMFYLQQQENIKIEE